MSLHTLLLERRRISDGCWIWTGAKNAYGYGILRKNGRQLLVHRVAASLWLEFNLSSKLCVLHFCDNPPCFNPDHLYIGTRRLNTLDRWAKEKGEGYHHKRKGAR